MAKRQGSSPTGLDDDSDKTLVEAQPKGAAATTKRAIGRLDLDDSVSITAPAPDQRGRVRVPRGTASLRAPPPSRRDPVKATEMREEGRTLVSQTRDARRRRVWDKLDAARKFADDRIPRLRGFQPSRGPKDPKDE